jgi:hypothetical protein
MLVAGRKLGLARSASAVYGKSRASKRVFIDEPCGVLDAGAQMGHGHLDIGCLGAKRTESRWIQEHDRAARTSVERSRLERPVLAFHGRVIRIAATFGARKLKSDAANEASDERVVEVVVSADAVLFLIGQRVLVKFMKPGQKPGHAHAGANQRASTS